MPSFAFDVDATVAVAGPTDVDAIAAVAGPIDVGATDAAAAPIGVDSTQLVAGASVAAASGVAADVAVYVAPYAAPCAAGLVYHFLGLYSFAPGQGSLRNSWPDLEPPLHFWNLQEMLFLHAILTKFDAAGVPRAPPCWPCAATGTALPGSQPAASSTYLQCLVTCPHWWTRQRLPPSPTFKKKN